MRCFHLKLLPMVGKLQNCNVNEVEMIWSTFKRITVFIRKINSHDINVRICVVPSLHGYAIEAQYPSTTQAYKVTPLRDKLLFCEPSFSPFSFGIEKSKSPSIISPEENQHRQRQLLFQPPPGWSADLESIDQRQPLLIHQESSGGVAYSAPWAGIRFKDQWTRLTPPDHSFPHWSLWLSLFRSYRGRQR